MHLFMMKSRKLEMHYLSITVKNAKLGQIKFNSSKNASRSYTTRLFKTHKKRSGRKIHHVLIGTNYQTHK